MMIRPARKFPKNQFKCFHCRELFTQRDGNWFDWNQMQVHLCHSCDKLTAEKFERTQKVAPRLR